jgi:hypothetical protein
MKRMIICFILILLLSACAHQTMWTLPKGTTIEQFRRDNLQCKTYAERQSGVPVASYYLIRTEYHNCMQSLGYIGSQGEMKWFTY